MMFYFTKFVFLQAEPSPKTPKKNVVFEIDQLQKLTDSEKNLEVKAEEEEQEEMVSDGKFKVEQKSEQHHEETSSTVTGKLKKRITRKVK